MLLKVANSSQIAFCIDILLRLYYNYPNQPCLN